MPNKLFLEDYPLFRKFKIGLPKTLDSFPAPAINIQCQVCESAQTFIMTNDYWEFHQYMNADAREEKVRLLYLCQSCRKFTR